KMVKRRIAVGNKIGNDVNFKLWRMSVNAGSRASSTESHSSRQSPPACVARTKKRRTTSAERKIATIHSAVLIRRVFKMRRGSAPQKKVARGGKRGNKMPAIQPYPRRGTQPRLGRSRGFHRNPSLQWL